jgi:hypothetical protein
MELSALAAASQLVLALGVLGVVALLVQFVLALRGRRVAAPLWGLPAALVVTVALGASWMQLGDVLALAGGHSRAFAPRLVTTGGAAALPPALWGSALGGGLALIASWLLGLFPLLRRAPETRWSLGHAVLPAVLAAGGAPILARFTPPIAPLIVLVASVPCVLVALRCARSEARASAVGSGLASSRFSVAVLATLGALALAQAVRIHSAWAVMRAVGMAAATTKQQLLAAMHHHHAGPATILAALVVLVVGTAVVVPVARRAWDRWAVLSGLLLLGLALPPLGARHLLADRLEQVREAARPWYEDRVEALAARGLELPRSTALKMPLDVLTIGVSPTELRVDEQVIPRDGELRDGLHWPLFEALDGYAVSYAELVEDDLTFRGTLMLEAHGELRWDELEPLLRAVVGARFQEVALAVRSEERQLRVLDVNLVGPVHPSAGSTSPSVAVSNDEERFVRLAYDLDKRDPPRIQLEALDGVWRLSTPYMEPQLASDTAQLAVAARLIKDQYPEDEDLMVFPVASTRWAELVAALDAVRGPGNYEDVMFPYPRFVLAELEPAEAMPQP